MKDTQKQKQSNNETPSTSTGIHPSNSINGSQFKSNEMRIEFCETLRVGEAIIKRLK